MKDEIMALGLITFGLISFEIINTVGIKQTGLFKDFCDILY